MYSTAHSLKDFEVKRCANEACFSCLLADQGSQALPQHDNVHDPCLSCISREKRRDMRPNPEFLRLRRRCNEAPRLNEFNVDLLDFLSYKVKSPEHLRRHDCLPI